jgi:hypothetical protein
MPQLSCNRADFCLAASWLPTGSYLGSMVRHCLCGPVPGQIYNRIPRPIQRMVQMFAIARRQILHAHRSYETRGGLLSGSALACCARRNTAICGRSDLSLLRPFASLVPLISRVRRCSIRMSLTCHLEQKLARYFFLSRTRTRRSRPGDGADPRRIVFQRTSTCQISLPQAGLSAFSATIGR